MKTAKKQGFTLIELVVVIIILGILAVTAVPKFINLQSDARASSVEEIKAALQGANSFIHAKAVIQGLENSVGDLVLDNMGNSDPSDDITVPTVYGYLDVGNDTQDSIANLEHVMDIKFETLPDDTTAATQDWAVLTHDDTGFYIVPKGKKATDECRLEYDVATEENNVITPAQYKAVTAGC